MQYDAIISVQVAEYMSSLYMYFIQHSTFDIRHPTVDNDLSPPKGQTYMLNAVFADVQVDQRVEFTESLQRAQLVRSQTQCCNVAESGVDARQGADAVVGQV